MSLSFKSWDLRKQQISEAEKNIFKDLPDVPDTGRSWLLILPEPFYSAQEYFNDTLAKQIVSSVLKFSILPFVIMLVAFHLSSDVGSISWLATLAQCGTVAAMIFTVLVVDTKNSSPAVNVQMLKFSLPFLFLLSMMYSHAIAPLSVSAVMVSMLMTCLFVAFTILNIYWKALFCTFHVTVGTAVALVSSSITRIDAVTAAYHMGFTILFVLIVSAFVNSLYNAIFMKALALYKVEMKTDRMLRNILPDTIVDEFNSSAPGTSFVRRFESVTVMFADLVGFAKYCSENSPEAVVDILNKLFGRFDASIRHLGLEKIKTIGDAYMIAGGVPKPTSDHAQKMVDLALDLREAVDKFNYLNNCSFELRIGIHSGPVIAGLIGKDRCTYDLWGDTVNIASRLESNGTPGEILLTKSTADQLGDQYTFRNHAIIELKGRGPIKVCYLERPHIRSPLPIFDPIARSA